ASPTPAPAGQTRRTSQRQALRRPTSRTAFNQSHEPAAPSAYAAPAAPQRRSQSQQQYHHHHDDTSEDEIPVPMKLSALTKALLNDGDPVSTSGSAVNERPPQPSPPRTRRQAHALNTSTSSATESRRHLRSGSTQP